MLPGTATECLTFSEVPPLGGIRSAATFRGLNFSKNDGKLAGRKIGYYRSPLLSAVERIPPSPPVFLIRSVSLLSGVLLAIEDP